MFIIILFAFLLFILLLLIGLTYYFRSLTRQKTSQQAEAFNLPVKDDDERLETSHGYIYAAIVLCIVVLILLGWYAAKGTPWEAHIIDWLHIVIRLMHITFGIAWIGASFYFVFLENALNRTDGVRDELAGNLWAIHGGGFYYLEKYKVAPAVIPKTLHWFKYEAYFTWLTGCSLLFVVYYFNASAFLIDKNVLDISPAAGVTIGIASLVVGWLVYHLLCKTALVYKGAWFGLAGFALATAFAFLYSHLFSGRAAYIHFGALLGTLMAGNVFFVIIPAQKAMVHAAKLGVPPNAAIGKFAGLRSLHNNYLTLPVLFVMVSNHFPSTFGHQNGWLVLAIITLGTAGVKHWLNLKEKGQLNVWVLPVSVVVLFGAAFLSAPAKPNTNCTNEILFAQVNAIIQNRCASCHAAQPTDEVFTVAPNGVKYDTPADIVKMKDKIMERVVITKTMPQNNKTSMTQEERDIIGCWIKQGASLK